MFLSEPNKPHICFVAPSLYPMLADERSAQVAGGAEAQQRLIVKALRTRGYTVTVITDDFGQPDEVEIDGIRIIRINKPRTGLPYIRFFHPGITSLWKAMSRANADIYYQRSAGWPTGAVGLYCKWHRRKFVYAAAHDLDLIRNRTKEIFNYRTGGRAYLFYRAGLRCADVIVVQGAVQEAACRTWHNRDSKRIASCYAPMGESTCRSGQAAVLWVAALRRWKRPELFLELARRLPNLRFRMIGGAAPGEEGGAFYRHIEAEAKGIPNLEFLGFQPPAVADAHFDAALVFVNTSDNEGFPNTFLQSWARSVPTISFVDCGARSDTRPIGRVTRDLDAMVEAVNEIASNDLLRTMEGQRCRRHFEEHHSVDLVGEQYDRLLSSLMLQPK